MLMSLLRARLVSHEDDDDDDDDDDRLAANRRRPNWHPERSILFALRCSPVREPILGSAGRKKCRFAAARAFNSPPNKKVGAISLVCVCACDDCDCDE